jgi:hypothetical protein
VNDTEMAAHSRIAIVTGANKGIGLAIGIAARLPPEEIAITSLIFDSAKPGNSISTIVS